MDYVIEPYKAVNEISFGMTQEQVEKIAGPADKSEPNRILRYVKETRGDCRLKYYEDGGLKVVEITKSDNPIVNGIAVFKAGGFEKLCDLEKPVVGRTNTYMLFRKLGLCLGGYAKKRVPDGKVLIAFSEDSLAHYEDFIDV